MGQTSLLTELGLGLPTIQIAASTMQLTLGSKPTPSIPQSHRPGR